jgi:hypothetical protein
MFGEFRAEFDEFMAIDVFSCDVKFSFDAFFDGNTIDIKAEGKKHVESTHALVACGKINVCIVDSMAGMERA